MAFEIQISGTEAMSRRLLEIGQDAPRAATRALNHVLGTTRTLASRGIAQDLGLTRRAVDRSIETTRATFSRQIATLRVGGYQDARGRFTPSGRIPLVDFGARGPEPSRGKGRGVSYRLPTGRGRVERGFLATMQSGHRGVFARKGAARRLPIIELFGPSPQRVFSQKILADAVRQGEAALEARLNHEINFILSQRVPAGDGAVP